MVKEEEAQRREGEHWVKISPMLDVTEATLIETLNAHKILTKEIRNIHGGFLVHLMDESAQTSIMSFNGRPLAGKAVKVTRAYPKMTGEEIFAWVEQKLRLEEEAKELTRVSRELFHPQVKHSANLDAFVPFSVTIANANTTNDQPSPTSIMHDTDPHDPFLNAPATQAPPMAGCDRKGHPHVSFDTGEAYTPGGDMQHAGRL